MRQSVDSPDRTYSLRCALISYLLVNCMEWYLLNPNIADYQAQSGYKLLHQWIADNLAANQAFDLRILKLSKTTYFGSLDAKIYTMLVCGELDDLNIN